MMKVLITGATGFVGQRLVRRLLDEGHELLALVRNPENARTMLPQPCRLEEWSGQVPISPGLLRQIDAVVNLAGESIAAKRWTKARKDQLRRSRIDLTRHLVNSFKSAGSHLKTFISTSAIGVYGDRGEEVLDETSGPGHDFLADLCLQWEAEASRAETLLSTRVVILRMGVILGLGGGYMRAVETPFSLGIGGRLGSGRQWFSWIHVNDVVAMISQALNDSHWRGVFNAVTPSPIRNVDLTRSLGRYFGKPSILPAPEFVLRVALGELSQALIASQSVRPKRAVELGFFFSYQNVDDALKE